MAISRVRTTGKVSHNGSSSAGSFAALPSAGNFVVVIIQGSLLNLVWANGDVTDNQSNTYTLAVQSPATDASNRSRTAIFYAQNIGSPSGTFTVTLNNGQSYQGNWSAVEFSGIATASSLDKTANASNTTGSPDTGATATTSQADELLVTSMGIRDTKSSITNTGWTEEWETLDFAFDEPGEGDTKIVSATGTYNSAPTLGNGGGVWSSCIATFKAAAGGGGATVTNYMTLLGAGT